MRAPCFLQLVPENSVSSDNILLGRRILFIIAGLNCCRLWCLWAAHRKTKRLSLSFLCLCNLRLCVPPWAGEVTGVFHSWVHSWVFIHKKVMHAGLWCIPVSLLPSGLDLRLHTHWSGLRCPAEHSFPLAEAKTSCLCPSGLKGNVWFECREARSRLSTG